MKISRDRVPRTRFPVSQDEARRLFPYLDSGGYVFQTFKQYKNKLLIRDQHVSIDKIFDVPEPGYKYSILTLYYEDGLPYLHRSNVSYSPHRVNSLTNIRVYDYNREDLKHLLPVAREVYGLHKKRKLCLEDYASHIRKYDMQRRYSWSQLARIRLYSEDWLNGNAIIPFICRASVKLVRGKLTLITDHNRLAEPIAVFGEYNPLEGRKCLLEILYSKDREKCKLIISGCDQTYEIQETVKQLRVLV